MLFIISRKSAALEIESLIQSAHPRVRQNEHWGTLKFVAHQARRILNYIVSEQELTFEHLIAISSDYEWWCTNNNNIITTDLLFRELLKQNQLTEAIQKSTNVKSQSEWKQMVIELKNNNEHENEDESECEMTDAASIHLMIPTADMSTST